MNRWLMHDWEGVFISLRALFGVRASAYNRRGNIGVLAGILIGTKM
jgi:hypothetical protein